MNLASHTKILKALGNKNRLAILSAIANSPIEISVTNIIKALNQRYHIKLSQPATSQALNILKKHKLVVGRRDDKKVFYSLKIDRSKLDYLNISLSNFK